MTYKDLKPFIAPHKTRLWVTLAVLSVLIIGEVVLTCLIPVWRNYFYTILQLKQANNFYTALSYLGFLGGGLALCQGLKVWAGQLFSFKVRTIIVEYFHRRWYKTKKTPQSFGQVLTGSVMAATTHFMRIGMESIISLCIVLMLIWVNWSNGLLLLTAGGYTVALITGAVLFYKPTIARNISQQRAYGEYRDYLTQHPDQLTKSMFVAICDHFNATYYKFIRITLGFDLYGRIGGAAMHLIPYILMSHSYFTGATTLGEFMATVATFELIVANSTILIQLFPQIIDSLGSWKMLKKLDFDFKLHYTQVKDTHKGASHE